jgi:branched-chain amino acid transport system ATP-binding protein
MLRTVMGLLRPWQGSVWFEGQDVSRLSAHEKAEMGLILVPEGRQLFTSMTVEENLEMGATPQRARPYVRQNLEMIYSMFPRLKERASQKAGTLSGGEQQMLAVARGIMAHPKVLMFDELSLGLAPVLVLQLFENLIEIKKTGLSMLLVEQNVQMALAVSDYGFVLSQGKIALEGQNTELMGDAHIRETYLGL